MSRHAQLLAKTEPTPTTRSASPFFGASEPAPFFSPAFVQTKLTVGPVGDRYEQEADAVADRVVSGPVPNVNATSPLPGRVQRKTDDKEKDKVRRKADEKEKDKLRRSPEPMVRLEVDEEQKKGVRRRSTAPGTTPAVPSGFESSLSASRAGGQPLSADVRAYMEPRIGADFSSVRVHTDAPAVQMSRQIGAQAFTHENHIYFGEGRYQPGSSGGNHLLAHELTHVVQQGAAPQTPALQRSAAPTITAAPAPTVQRLFGIDLDPRPTIDGWLAAIPGWRLLTTLVGYNPVLGQAVARSTENLIEGFLTLGGPLGLLLFNRLRAEGVVARAATWIDAQVASLGVSYSYVSGLFSQAWSEMGITLGVGGNLAVIRRVFGPPLGRMLAFAGRVLGQVVQFLKDTLLRPLSQRARQMRGFPLLTVIIGSDPFTDEVVERSPTNLVRGFMSLMEGGEERFQQMQQSGALDRAFAWFGAETAKRNLTLARLKATFSAAFDLLTPEAVLHPLDTIGQLVGLFSGLVTDLVGFAGAALMQMLEFIFEAVMGGGGARVLAVLKRARDTFHVIIRNPVGFVGNLVRAGRQGFQQFMTNIGGHLQRGLTGWLLGSLEGAGLQLPQTFDLRGILSLALQVLGITYQNIRGKLVRATSEGFVSRLEQVFEFIRILVTQGPAAAWQKILEYMANLRDMVLDGIRNWVMRTVVGQAVIRIVSMLNPAGAVIQAIMATYNTVMFFMERINQIAAVVESYVNSIAAIAAGNIGAAANRVEQTMANMVPVIIGFLARLLGLGGISDTIRGLIARVRQPVDRALDSVVNWVVAQGRRLVGAVVTAGTPQDPGQRVDAALAVAVPIVNRFAGRPVGEAVLTPLLAGLRMRYQLSLIEVIPTPQGVWAVRAAASPPKTAPTLAGVAGGTPTAAAPTGTPPAIGSWIKNKTANKLEKIIQVYNNMSGAPRNAPPTSIAARTDTNSVSNYQLAQENTTWERSSFAHVSNFVTDGGSASQFALKPAYQGGTTIRSTFYRDPTTRPSLASRLSGLRAGAPAGTFFSEAPASQEAAFGYAVLTGRAVIPNADYSEDHNPPIAQHWNNNGYQIGQAAREGWNGTTGTFELISRRLNSSRGSGGARYTPEVKIGFRGPGDPP